MTYQPTEPKPESPAEKIVLEEKLRKVDAEVIDAEDSAYKSGDQDIDTAGTDADDDPLTRPKAATARSRRSSPDNGRAEAESPTKALGAGIEVPKSTD